MARQWCSAMVASLRKAEVKLLQSDKAGGFVLMPKVLYDSKAEEALRKNFKVLTDIKGTRVKTQAAKLRRSGANSFGRLAEFAKSLPGSPKFQLRYKLMVNNEYYK
ncbi:hypothetical protein MRX96_059782 [Rhipicephalus microplus]